MNEPKDKELATPCVRTLFDRMFFVPYYQRGYRWENTQVKQLLKDINENTKEGSEYSLQPIVVAKKDMSIGMDRWELIDGQQRLTTLNLFLLALGEKQISIEYARHQGDQDEQIGNLGLEIYQHLSVRITCLEDWEQIKQEIPRFDTVDNHHIVNAWLAIKTWLKMNQSDGSYMSSAVLDRTRVIWHEVGSENGTSEFLRFNTGKIHLSPCELLKARFLATYKSTMIHRSPSEIASEWDQMESAFHEAEFWSFLNPSKNVSEAPNRIALLFELLAPSKKDDLAGRCYLDKFPEPTQVPEIEEIWHELRKCFLTLQEWYNDRETRHKVGFLRWARTAKEIELSDLLESFQKGRSAFHTWLSEKIKVCLAPPNKPQRWQEAKFDDPNDRHYLQDVLLWFNIDTLPPENDYSFSRHATVSTWSLEHIHAQSSLEEADSKQFEDWKNGCTTLLNHLQKKRTAIDSQNQQNTLNINELLVQISALTVKDGLSPETLKAIKRLDEDVKTMLPNPIGDDLNKVWNLALLGGRENSSLSNAFFHQKRRMILEFEECVECFVPPATVRVFLKGYSIDPDDLILWAAKDREAYKNRIDKVLQFTTKKGTPNHV